MVKVTLFLAPVFTEIHGSLASMGSAASGDTSECLLFNVLHDQGQAVSSATPAADLYLRSRTLDSRCESVGK